MDDGKTKVIIITSNEDLIKEISSKKRTNTHLIDLDDRLLHLTLLAQLSQSVRILFDEIYRERFCVFRMRQMI